MRSPQRLAMIPKRDADALPIKGGVKTIATRQIEIAAPLVAAAFGDGAKRDALWRARFRHEFPEACPCRASV